MDSASLKGATRAVFTLLCVYLCIKAPSAMRYRAVAPPGAEPDTPDLWVSLESSSSFDS